MSTYRAFLIDVYDTVVTVDLAGHSAALAEYVGADPRLLAEALAGHGSGVMDGSLSLEEAFGAAIEVCNVPPGGDGVAGVVARHHELLREVTEVPSDVMPFLHGLRDAGVRSAYVSNCAEDTRSLLEENGLGALVDELVLSCEVGAVKPSPAIFEVALDRLGVAADEAVFVDDQQAFCDAAAALGIRSVRIDRRGGGPGAIRSLAELEGLL